MAVLHNEAKTLRFSLELVDRELTAVDPARRPDPAHVRILGSAGVEFFDRRDQSFWPFVKLPVVYLAGSDAPDLIESARNLTRLKSTGFAFRTGTENEVALQVGRAERTGFLVEVGIDLAPFLHETAGRKSAPGQDLALFRFNCGMSEVVVFADQLKQELDRLPPVAG